VIRRHEEQSKGVLSEGVHGAGWGRFLPFLPPPRNHAGVQNLTRNCKFVHCIRKGEGCKAISASADFAGLANSESI
jgi:hypothetical protein